MTKRYLNVLTTGNIKDTVTGELIRGSGIGDLLNELHEQLETCKDANTRCCNEYSAMRRDVLRYKEENEQLKQFKEYVFDLIDKDIKETKEIFEDGKIDLMMYNASMITLIGLKEQLKGDFE